jgi:Tfp pilus assembly protein PilN
MKAVNLLPSDIRGVAKPAAEAVVNVTKGGAGPFVVLGVLAACVAGLAGYVLANNTVKDRQAELAQVSVNQQALSAKVAALKPYADFDDMARSRVKTVRDLADSRFDWEQVLSDVSRAIPADVTLNKLAGNVSTDAGGGSGSGLRSAITAPAITLTGCAPGQTEVARLMSRMRDVDGVTRVTLSKSDSQEVTAQSASGTERETRNAMPCGSGLRPNFEIVLFFENVPAAVKASPNATTPAPAATPTPSATPSSTTSATTAPAQGGATP